MPRANAFVLRFQRDFSPVDSRQLETLLEDAPVAGRSLIEPLAQNWVGAGCLVAEHQIGVETQGLLSHCGLDEAPVLFDGRIDNRQELLTLLNADPATNDTSLAWDLYRRFGSEAFHKVLGDWCWVVVDQAKRKVIVARDPIGGRSAFYRLSDNSFLLASDPTILLADSQTSRDLDPSTLAAFFALREPDPARSFFRDIRQIPPGHVLEVGEREAKLSQYWDPIFHLPLEPASDQEYVEQFGSLLRDSVRCRLDDDEPTAILMSGGLDSTSVAAIAAMESRWAPRVTSWVFDELTQSDEREFIQPTVDHCGLEFYPVLGDELWPLKDPNRWPHEPDCPFQGLYRLLHDRSYGLVSDAGSRVLLNGIYSDELVVSSGLYWLRDLLLEGKLLQAAAEGWAHRRRPAPDSTSLMSAILKILNDPARGSERLDPPPPWLSDLGVENLPQIPPRPASRRFRQLQVMLSYEESSNLHVARRNASSKGLDLRHPFRDLRLIEFAARAPAHLLYRGGRPKWILRESMKGMLPESVRTRKRASSLMLLFLRGILNRELEFVGSLLRQKRPPWSDWVSSDWLRRQIRADITAPRDEIHWVVLWRCLSFDVWVRREGLEVPGWSDSNAS